MSLREELANRMPFDTVSIKRWRRPHTNFKKTLFLKRRCSNNENGASSRNHGPDVDPGD